MEADQQCGYLRIETIIWKEEILPLIFYITLELNLSIGYKITKKQTKNTELPNLQTTNINQITN